MESITWKNVDTSGRKFELEQGNHSVGTLTLLSSLSSNGTFRTPEDSVKFSHLGFWHNKLQLRRKDEVVGEIRNRLVGQTYLKLKSGKTFWLTSNLIGRNLKWLDSRGVPVVEYSMATLKSMRKGSIQASESLDKGETEILVSGGLVAGKFNVYRLGIMVLGIAALIRIVVSLI